MDKIWLGKNVSLNNLMAIARCFSSCFDNAEISAAVRIAKMCASDESCTDEQVREGVKEVILSQVKSANYRYNERSVDRDNLFVTLCLFMDMSKAYNLVDGICGEKQLEVTFADESNGRIYVDGKLIDRIW